MHRKVAIYTLLIGLLALVFISVSPVSAWTFPDCTSDARYEEFGPRADKMLIKLHTDEIAEFTALETGEIDFTDWPLPKAYYVKYTNPPWNEKIKVVSYGAEKGFRIIDLNCLPNVPGTGEFNPMSIIALRHAVWHCMDRAYAVDVIWGGLALPMYSVMTAAFPNYLHKDIAPGGALEVLVHPYNITEAQRILDEAGIVDGPDADSWREWPPGNNLKLKYYIRGDDTLRRQLGLWHAAQIEAAGVEVDELVGDYWFCYTPVMLEHQHQLYTGGWSVGVDPDHVDLWKSEYYWYPGFCYNYNGMNCSTYDYWATRLIEANTLDEAKEAAYMCQEVFNDPHVVDNYPGVGGSPHTPICTCPNGAMGSCPVLCAQGFEAVRRRYTGGSDEVPQGDGEDVYRGQEWCGVISVPGYGTDQDFSNLYPEGYLVGDGQHMTLRWGFKVDKMVKLNPLYAEWLWDNNVLDLIYNTLIGRTDYTLEFDTTPLTEAFSVGTWTDQQGNVKTKVTVTLRNDVYWHDGVPFSMADVIYTLWEMPREILANGLPPPWYWSNVRYILSFSIIDPFTVEMLLDIKSVWAVGMIAGVRILPKHVWKPLLLEYNKTRQPDMTGVSPDPNLIGTGDWRYVEYVGGAGGHHLLVRNEKGVTVQTNLSNELGPSKPITQTGDVFTTCPVFVSVDTMGYSHKLPAYTTSTFKVTLHNRWLNPVPYSATGPSTGSLQVMKYVYVINYTTGEEIPLVDGELVTLPACEEVEETFDLYFKVCHYAIKVAVHIVGPANVDIWKDNAMVSVPNPWVCRWQNYTYHFWATIREDIAGDYFDAWHGIKYTAPGGSSPANDYLVPKEVPTPDCKVDMINDIRRAARAFGSYPGHERWDSVSDINRDYKVDMVNDIRLIAKKFGWSG